MPTATQALVLYGVGEPFVLRDIVVDDPLADELLVKISSVGLCHTDVSIQHGVLPGVFPGVLGHEGVGTVEQVGADVQGLAAGDTVLLSFNSCGTCKICTRGHPASCTSWFPLNFGFARSSGAQYFATDNLTGKPIAGNFFGQSAMSGYTLASPRSCTKISSELDTELFGPLGCGIMTGFGAVYNVLKPESSSAIGIWGLGGVGISSLLAAKHLGVGTIIAVDIVPERLALAKKLGATHVVNGLDKDVKSQIEAITKGDMLSHVVEATGVLPCVALSFDCLGASVPLTVLKRLASISHRFLGGNRLGVHGQVGALPMGSANPIDLTMAQIQQKSVKAILMGDANPTGFVPKLVEWSKDGTIPLKEFCRVYPVKDFQKAVDSMKDGSTIKPIISFA